MINYITMHKDIPIKYDVDVMIAGGGPAGVAAAVKAAESGVSVFLAEKSQCFGGMGTIAKVPAFMRFSDGIHFLGGDIGKRIFDALYGKDADYTQIEYPIETEKLKRIYDQLMEESGAEFSFESIVTDIILCENSHIEYAVVHGKEKSFAVKAKIFIDATGDGSIAVMSGAKFEKGDDAGNTMPGTLCSQWADIDWNKAVVELGKDPDNRMLHKAFEDKVFTIEDPGLPGMWHRNDQLGGGNIGHVFGVDGTDEDSITKYMMEARKRMCEYITYYNKYLPGYEHAKLTATADVLGIRETRRILCEYMMSAEDYFNSANFEDEIGRYCYPIDIHAAFIGDKPKYADLYEQGYAKGKSYGIAYRSLLPQNTDNLLVAGRCMGADRSVMGSLRVMPACYITGAAAGAAAAEAVIQERNLREIDIKKLQERVLNHSN